MKKLIYSITLSAFIMISACGQIYAQSVSEVSHEKTMALELYTKGEYQKAYDLYSKLLRIDPADDAINLGYARSALQAGKLGQAVMSYERLLQKYPNEPILLKELAYALSMQNDNQRAQMELSKSSKAKGNASENLEKQQSRTKISGKVNAGVIYDSNVNAGPASNDITLGNWDLRLIDGKAEDALALYAGAKLDITHRFAQTSPWWLISNANVFAKYNFGEKVHDLDLSSSESLNASFGIRHLGVKTMFELKARAQFYDSSFKENIFAAGIGANFIYALNSKVFFISRLSLDNRAYSDNSDYNGWYSSLGQYVRFIMGEAGHALTFGGRYFNANADISNYSLDGFEASVDFKFILPYYDISLTPYFAYSAEFYKGPATSFEDKDRKDYQLRAGLNLLVPIAVDWDLNLGYQYLYNNSNSELYDYDRHLVNLGVSWSF